MLQAGNPRSGRRKDKHKAVIISTESRYVSPQSPSAGVPPRRVSLTTIGNIKCSVMAPIPFKLPKALPAVRRKFAASACLLISKMGRLD